MKIDKFKDREHWKDWVGKEVIKHSKKPFKGGKQVETIRGFEVNPHSCKIGFKMEDGSIVDCHQVTLYKEN